MFIAKSFPLISALVSGAFAIAVALGADRPPEPAASPSDSFPADAVSLAIGHGVDRLAKSRAADDKFLRDFYGGRDHEPVWSENGTLLPAAGQLVSRLASADDGGLSAADYRIEKLRRQLIGCEGGSRSSAAVRARTLASCELSLSRAFFRYASDLLRGRMDARRSGIAWYTEAREVDLGASLVEAARGGQMEAALDALAPRQPGFRRLEQTLGRLREIENNGGWPELAGPPSRYTSDAPEAQAARSELERRLAFAAALDPLAGRPTNPSPDLPADPLAAAVARFQERHGLEVTGVVGEKTLAALNVPAAVRRRQVELNLERWRWLPESLGERYVMVNVPAFELELVEGGVSRLTMPVVVGKTYQQTPSFSDTIEHLELNPYWNVPPSIVRSEILPAIEKRGDYLESENMDVVGADGDLPRIRQRPGPGNSLGRIKFVLPNEHNIYLHDTPAGHLFARSERDFSHGCIRLQAPLDLALALLRDDPAWDRARLERGIATGENIAVKLPEPVPVHILYWTAWVDDVGTLHFRDDLYSVDSKLAKALAHRDRDAQAVVAAR